METVPNFKDVLLKRLIEKGVRPECEACGQNNWSVVDQPVGVMIVNLSGAFQIPPPHIPSVALICNNCGNVRIFALGVLGLLSPQKEGGKNG